MDAGTLQLKLMADISGLVSGMNTARENVSSSMGTMSGAIDVAKTALVGLVGVGSVGVFATMIASTIEAQGALQDMATKTGASAAALDAFRVIGATSETSIDKVTDAMNKLGKNMVTATDDGKGASAAMSALGLNFDTIKAMKPEEQMLTVATAMNNFADGADKGAVAQELFGKQGAALLPFLKDLGNEAGNVTTKLTEQEVAYRATQAAMADAFGDNLTSIKRETDGWKRDLSEGMTPALYSASAAFLAVTTESGGMKDKIHELSRDGTFASWTTTAINGLTYVMDAFSGVGTVVTSVGLTIGAWAAGVGSAVTTAMTMFKQATDGDFTGAMATMRGGIEQQKTIAGELATSLDAAWGEQTLGSKLRARIADINATGLAGEAIKPQMNYSGTLEANETAHKANTKEARLAEQAAKDLAAEIKKQEDANLKLNTSIEAKTNLLLAELNQTTPLTAAQKEEVTLLANLDAGIVKMTPSQKEATLAALANWKEVEKQVAEYKKQEAEVKANTTANNDLIAKLEKSTSEIDAQTDKVKDNTSKLGLNREELAELSIKKDYDTAATYDQKAAWAEQNDLGADLVQQYRDQATALRNLADAKQQGIHVKAAVDAAVEWRKTTDSISSGLSSALLSAVGSGKDIWLTFRDFMVRTILDGAIKNALTGVINEGMNWLMSSISGIKIGGGTGGSLISTGLSTIGSAVTGGISSIGSGITSALGLGGATTAAAGGTAATATAVTGGGSVVATDLGLLGTGSTATTATTATTGATAAGTSTLASLAGPAFFAAIGLKLLSGSSLPTKIGATFSATEDGVTKLYGNATGGEFAGGVQQSALLDTLHYINTQLAAAGSTVKVTSLNGGGESGEWSTQSYSFAGGTLSNGMTFGTPTQHGDNLGIATPDEVFAAYVADLQAAAAQAIELGLTGTAVTPLVQHTFKPATGPDPTTEFDISGFGAGGDHMGGLRIVGENGPELEATGPSRIFDAATTASMLRSGGASNDEVVAELRAMRLQLAQLHQEARRTADATNGNPESPMIVEIDA